MCGDVGDPTDVDRLIVISMDCLDRSKDIGLAVRSVKPRANVGDDEKERDARPDKGRASILSFRSSKAEAFTQIAGLDIDWHLITS
jgi:hypothetical protein